MAKKEPKLLQKGIFIVSTPETNLAGMVLSSSFPLAVASSPSTPSSSLTRLPLDLSGGSKMGFITVALSRQNISQRKNPCLGGPKHL
jgi:hypothetical protein